MHSLRYFYDAGSQRKTAAADHSPFAHVMGSHQHARRIRFFRRKAPRYPRNPAPEKGSVAEVKKWEERKQKKARLHNAMPRDLCRVSYLCWDEPNPTHWRPQECHN